MTEFDAERASMIDSFVLNGTGYTHMIDMGNDSVYLLDEKNTVLLEYTSSCDIFDLTGETRRRLGRFQLQYQECWVLLNDILGTETLGRSFKDPDGLLKDEVDFSKHWLSNQDKYAPPKEKTSGVSTVGDKTVLTYHEKYTQALPTLPLDDTKRILAAREKRQRKAEKRLAQMTKP